jgi:hypothetical protein
VAAEEPFRALRSSRSAGDDICPAAKMSERSRLQESEAVHERVAKILERHDAVGCIEKGYSPPQAVVADLTRVLDTVSVRDLFVCGRIPAIRRAATVLSLIPGAGSLRLLEDLSCSAQRVRRSGSPGGLLFTLRALLGSGLLRFGDEARGSQILHDLATQVEEIEVHPPGMREDHLEWIHTELSGNTEAFSSLVRRRHRHPQEEDLAALAPWTYRLPYDEIRQEFARVADELSGRLSARASEQFDLWVRVGEYGLALEGLEDWLTEDQVEISPRTYERFERLMDLMEYQPTIDLSTFRRLVRR